MIHTALEGMHLLQLPQGVACMYVKVNAQHQLVFVVHNCDIMLHIFACNTVQICQHEHVQTYSTVVDVRSSTMHAIDH